MKSGHNGFQKMLGRITETRLDRKDFLKFLGLAVAWLAFSHGQSREALARTGEKLKPRASRKIPTDCDIAAAKGKGPAENTRNAVNALGGMARFVHKGDIVVVKPNIGWDRTPEQAANTNPEVVAELVRMSLEAGAKTVKVFDNPCNNELRTYKNSGIYSAVKRAKGKISYMSYWKYMPAEFPEGSLMAGWPLYFDAVECDCFINAPVAKHHGLSRLTLSMKNLMGVCGGNRGEMHRDISIKLAELTAFMKPELTVIDATRILAANGPTGGNLNDVIEKNTVIAGGNPVTTDAYAATLFGMEPEEIGHIKKASEMGLGSCDLKKANIRHL